MRETSNCCWISYKDRRPQTQNSLGNNLYTSISKKTSSSGSQLFMCKKLTSNCGPYHVTESIGSPEGKMILLDMFTLPHKNKLRTMIIFYRGPPKRALILQLDRQIVWVVVNPNWLTNSSMRGCHGRSDTFSSLKTFPISSSVEQRELRHHH